MRVSISFTAENGSAVKVRGAFNPDTLESNALEIERWYVGKDDETEVLSFYDYESNYEIISYNEKGTWAIDYVRQYDDKGDLVCETNAKDLRKATIKVW